MELYENLVAKRWKEKKYLQLQLHVNNVNLDIWEKCIYKKLLIYWPTDKVNMTIYKKKINY